MAGRKKQEKNRRPSSGVAVRLIIMLAVVAAIVFGVAIFFKVTTIEVQGNTLYSAEDVIAASGIEPGDNLLLVNKATTAGNILAALPYVEEVRGIVRSLPDTVVIQIQESEASFAVQTDVNTTWLVNSRGKALEKVEGELPGGQPQILPGGGDDGHGGGAEPARRGARGAVRAGRHGHFGACGVHQRGKGL